MILPLNILLIIEAVFHVHTGVKASRAVILPEVSHGVLLVRNWVLS